MIAAVDRMARHFGKAVLTVLLVFFAATPALAAWDCLDEVSSQPSQLASALIVSVASPEPADDQGEPGRSDKVVHCAFSHCAHHLQVLSPEHKISNVGSPATAYLPPIEQPLLEAARDGPDHPPRA